MQQRNWAQLSRKLVSRYDMLYSFDAVQTYLGEQALAFFGEGVLVTTTYPNPFPITMSGSSLGGSVGTGIAFDPNGNITRIDPGTTTPISFALAAADVVNPRWDLLVIRYKQTGDTLIPMPSDPIVSVDLNLHDDFQLVIIKGTASSSPSYPAKVAATDIILCGLRVPANATLGTSVTVDTSIRDIALPYEYAFPVFQQETPSGAVNGTNTTFTLSQAPINGQSVLVMVDDLVLSQGEWSIIGQSISLATAPVAGQSVFCWYVTNGGGGAATLPIYAEQEVLSTGANGSQTSFPMSGNPINQNTCFIFLNGQYVEPSNYSILSGGGSSSVVFNSAPAVASSISAFYFQNLPAANTSSPITSGSNLGSGLGLYAGVSGQILQFKSIKAGSNVGLSDDGLGTVTISATGGGSGGGREAHGSAASPIYIDPTVGLVPTTASNQVWWIKPTAGEGAVNFTSALQIAAGVTIGQQLALKGTSSSDYYVLANGSGINQNGVCTLTDNQSIIYTWDGSVWSEDTRRL